MVKATGALTPTELDLIQKRLDFSEGSESPLAIWVIGRPASGKTTVATLLCNTLQWEGHRAELVNGDQIRAFLGSFHGFSPEERLSVFKKYVDLNQILQDRGIIPVTATVGGSAEWRNIVRSNLENAKFIYLNCPIEIAASRDQKGLYDRVAAGELGHFVNLALLFPEPIKSDIEFDSTKMNPLKIVIEIMEYLRRASLLRGH